MIKAIWDSFKVPVVSMFTGRYMGYPATRNPFKWIGVIAFGIVLLPFTIIVYPFILLSMYVGILYPFKKGLSAKIEESEIIVMDQKRNATESYAFSDITKVISRLDPPFTYPVIQLENGKNIQLRKEKCNEFIEKCNKVGIKTDNSTRIGA